MPQEEKLGGVTKNKRRDQETIARGGELGGEFGQRRSLGFGCIHSSFDIIGISHSQFVDDGVCRCCTVLRKLLLTPSPGASKLCQKYRYCTAVSPN